MSRFPIHDLKKMSKTSELEKLILKWSLLKSLICKSLRREEAMRRRWGGEREKGEDEEEQQRYHPHKSTEFVTMKKRMSLIRLQK